MSASSILILAGDGIGPEVMGEVRRVIDWFAKNKGLSFDVSEDLVGGAAYDAHGTPLHDDTMAKAQAADAVLLGAVGGPKYDDLDFSVKPERGLLRLRKEMDLYSNLRPAQCSQRYTESEIARVARSAFELARRRGNKVCSMEKANVMESGILWRTVVTEIHEAEYPDVELSHMYADAGAMQLCRWPKQFDVIWACCPQPPWVRR